MALIDLLGATRRYGELSGAVAICRIESPHPTMDELEAVVRDAEQALLAIFTAVFGEPDISYPESE